MTSGRRALAGVLVALLAAASGAAASGTPAAAAGPDGNGTTIVTDGEELVLDAAANQTIRGETDLAPGTSLSVNVEGEAFLQTTTTAVTGEQTFNVTLDLSTVGEQDVTVTVYRNETVLAEVDGRVVCETDCESTADSSDGSTTVVDGPAVQAVTEVTQNRTASIKVLFGGADTVTVSVGGPAVNYVVTGTVRDGDGDGRATVLFHTNRAGTDEPTLAVVDDNETRVVEASAETSLDSPLAPGTYDVRLYAGPNATGDVAAKGRVVVYEGTAPKSSDENDTSASDTTTPGTVAGGDNDGSSAGASGDRFLGGVGMIAAGGLLAVLGVGVVLGLFRN